MGICTIVVERRISPERGVKRRCFEHYNRMAVTAEAKTVGEMIRQRRVRDGLTQSELGKLLGASEWTVYEWEGGFSKPVKFRRLVAKWLGVSVKTLLNMP